MPIPFTQYERPNGKKTHIEITRPEAIETMAQEIIDKGYVFECEKLRTNEVSFTVTDTRLDGHGDICHRICATDRAVPVTVDELVKAAYKMLIGPTEAVMRRRGHVKWY